MNIETRSRLESAYELFRLAELDYQRCRAKGPIAAAVDAAVRLRRARASLLQINVSAALEERDA